MPKLQILKLLESHNVPYVTSGPNTAKGNISVSCPWCGDGDPSQHLGIRVDNLGYYKGAFGCWRNSSHRGKDPVRLVSKLLGISFDHARDLVGSAAPNLSEFDATVAALKTNNKTSTPEVLAKKLKMPESFKLIGESTFAVKYRNYLVRRGYPKNNLQALIKRYDLRYTLIGPYKDRIIFPVYFKKKLVTWTSRDVTGRSNLRYKTLSHKTKRDDEPLATMNIKDTLFNFHNLKGGKALYIVEGPFDCLKIDFYGNSGGANAVGLYSNAATPEQLDLLNGAIRKYKKVFVLLDEKEISQSMKLMRNLIHPHVRRADLGNSVEDPGDLSREAVFFYLAKHDSIL